MSIWPAKDVAGELRYTIDNKTPFSPEMLECVHARLLELEARATAAEAKVAQQEAELRTLRAERDAALAEGVAMGIEAAADSMENLSFFTDIDELIGMTKKAMSERTCHEGAAAIRALSPADIIAQHKT